MPASNPNHTLGQIAYEAYCAQTGWKSLVSGAQLPAWESVKLEIQTAWESAGEQVRLRVNGEHEAVKSKLRKALAGIVGVTESESAKDLEVLEMAIRANPACEEDRIVSLNAIHALRDTL